MSIVIPPLQQKIPKFHLDRYAPTTAIINTWYTLFEGVNVRPIMIVVAHTNTTPQAQTLSYRVTIDTVVFEVGFSNPSVDEKIYLAIGELATMGANPPLVESLKGTTFGLLNFEKSVGAENYSNETLGGHAVKVEAQITDIVGANQTLSGVVLYEKMEAV